RCSTLFPYTTLFRSVLVAYGEEDGVAVLGRLPRVLEDIPFDENAAGVLELEEVLHRRPHAAPRRRLEEMILPDLDVRGHEVADGGIGAPEDHVLARRLQIVVHDLERARAVPAHDGLSVHNLVLELGQIGVDDS